MAGADFSRCGLVVVAAGKGVRFGGYKQLVPLIDRPLLVHTLEAFLQSGFRQYVVVLPPDFILQGTWDNLVGTNPGLRIYEPVAGLDERALSVREGVRSLSRECQFVAVHDGARPLPPLGAMDRCLNLIQTDRQLSAVIVASPVTDTIKRVRESGPLIARTENRAELVRAETPQICDRIHLLNALSDPRNFAAGDEAQAMELLGLRTAFVLHDGFNPKITHAKDIAVINAWLTAKEETTPEPRREDLGRKRA
ncbi:NTP transferase domain-containing protein [bacterium]|nr:NTP transferase domain-containing protein [bacterium]